MSNNSSPATFVSTFGDSSNTEESLKYVQHRVQTGAHTNDHIADFLKKYSEIQGEFARKIDRLVRNSHPSAADLGTFEESFSTLLQVVATQGLESYDVSELVRKELEPKVRNKQGRKQVNEVLNSLYADSKNLSPHSYHTRAVSGMEKLQTIDEERLGRLSEAVDALGARSQANAQKTQELSTKLQQNLAHFTPQTDIESYLAKVTAGDVVFPDLSPAHSAGYSPNALSRYASPQMSGENGVRPQASPFAQNNAAKESRIKRFFSKGS